MNKIKTIITDIDGTLLNENNEISLKTKELLIKYQQQGIRLILASGRSTNAIIPISKELRMNEYNGLILSYNGACIVDCSTNKVIYSEHLDTDIATQILKHLDNFDVSVIVNDDERVYVHDVYKGIVELDGYYGDELQSYNAIEGEARSGNYLLCEVESLSNFVDFPLFKILAVANSNYFKQHRIDLIKPFLDNTTALFSSPFFLEFTQKNVDKGTTIAQELPRLGINPEHVIAFGDGMNDISMLKNVGIGVAMRNADEHVKFASDFVTKSNNDDGIVHTLLEFENYFI